MPHSASFSAMPRSMPREPPMTNAVRAFPSMTATAPLPPLADVRPGRRLGGDAHLDGADPGELGACAVAGREREHSGDRAGHDEAARPEREAEPGELPRRPRAAVPATPGRDRSHDRRCSARAP